MALPGFAIFLLTLLLLTSTAYLLFLLTTRLHASRHALPPPPANPLTYFRQHRARPSYPYPSPRPGGLIGWLSDHYPSFLTRRRHGGGGGGAYTETGSFVGGGGGGGGGRAGRHRAALDPDEAWDARVGNEADWMGAAGPGGFDEEQELGLRGSGAATPYDRLGYAGAGATGGYGYDELSDDEDADERRGRRRTELDRRYDEEVMRGGTRRGAGREDPFADPVPDRDGAAGADGIALRGVSPRPLDTTTATAAPRGHRPKHSGGTLGGGGEGSPTERRSMFREEM